MRRVLTTAFLPIAIACSICAQSSETFEVAVVRLSAPNSPFGSTLNPSRFIAMHQTLRMLIESSYPDLPAWRMSGGPPWATTDLWDVVAKLNAGAPTDQERLYRATEPMLRQREQPVYELLPGKGGPKLKPSDGGEADFRFTAGGFEAHHATPAAAGPFRSYTRP